MGSHLIPETLNDALKYLYGGEAKIIAGGTDLMVQHRSWAEIPAGFPKTMIFCAHLKELRGIVKIGNRVEIGAMTPLEEILRHPDTPPLLKTAISEMASPAIRNVATLAGNIGNASPAADSLPVLYILDAWVELQNLAGHRMILLKDLITGPRELHMHSEEMITKIVIPDHRFPVESFVKVGGRKADAIAKVSFAGVAEIENGIVTDLRIAFGAVAKTVVRDETAEGAWIGGTLSELKIGVWRLCDMYSSLITPIDDQRSDKHYRKEVALRLLKDFVEHL